MELTINVVESHSGEKSKPVVVRSVDDLDSSARRLARVIKDWLRAVPLTRGASRARFDITAQWTVAVPVNTNAGKVVSEEIGSGRAAAAFKRGVERAAGRKRKKHGR